MTPPRRRVERTTSSRSGRVAEGEFGAAADGGAGKAATDAFGEQGRGLLRRLRLDHAAGHQPVDGDLFERGFDEQPDHVRASRNGGHGTSRAASNGGMGRMVLSRQEW
jgi:hypothetical protein